MSGRRERRIFQSGLRAYRLIDHRWQSGCAIATRSIDYRCAQCVNARSADRTSSRIFTTTKSQCCSSVRTTRCRSWPTCARPRGDAIGALDRVALGVCSEITLTELAKILATTQIADRFKISRALNLDGGSSSAFWVKRETGSEFSIPEQKTVRDFVAVGAAR